MSYLRIYFLILEVLAASLVLLIPIAGLREMFWPGCVFFVGFVLLWASSIVCFCFKRHRRLAISGFAVVAFTLFCMMVFPGIGSIRPQAKADRNTLTAKSAVFIYHHGAQSGIVWQGSDRKAILESVIAGQKVTEGADAGKFIGFPVRPEQLADSYKYIGFDPARGLFFDETGGQPSS